MEKWESESLEWIHQVRQKLNEETKKMDLWETAQRTNKKAQHLIKEFGLKVVHPLRSS